VVDFDHHSPECWADVGAYADRARAEARIGWSPHHGGFWVVTRAREAKWIAQHPEIFSSSRFGAPEGCSNFVGVPAQPIGKAQPILEELDPPEHGKYRRLVNVTLAPREVTRLAPKIEGWATEVIDRFIESGECDLVTDFTSLVPVLATLEALGFPTDNWERFAKAFQHLEAPDGEAPGDERGGGGYHQPAELAQWVDAQCVEMAERRRLESGDDAASRWLSYEIDGAPISTERVAMLLWHVMVGGFDTTGRLTASVLKYLDEHPDDKQRLIDEPDLLDTATEEFIRFFPPARSHGRVVVEDTELAGRAMRTGDRLLLSWVAINRDEEVFGEDSRQIVLDRFPNRHASFSYGPHRCPGSHLAREDFKVMITQALARLPDYRIVTDGLVALTDQSMTGGYSKMPAVFTPGPRLRAALTGMTGPLAGQFLADNGADVVKIEPRAGDWARGMPGFLMWNRGKGSVALDLSDPDERERALSLILGADVLIESTRGGVEHALGLEDGSLLRMRPRLVHCAISGFGLADRWEHLPSYEGIVAARIGRFMGADHVSGLAEGNSGDRPVFNITPFGSYAAGCLALVGIVGALRSRAESGLGQHVNTSLLDGLAASAMRMPFRRKGDQVTPVTDTKARDIMFRGISLAFMTAECSDGRYIQMCARQADHFRRWFQAMGLESLLAEERFANGPVGFKSIADVEELDQLVRKAMRERPAAEWMKLFSETYDVGADPFLTSSEFLEMPDMVLNGRVVEIADPVAGPTRQVGPLALLSTSRHTIGRPAPILGQSQSILTPHDAVEGDSSEDEQQAGRPLRRPSLDGITVLEVAYFIAGPMASSIVAEMGARIIKLEPLEGDPFRHVSLEFAQLSHGKESITLDLKHPSGREILDQLLLKADVLLHSFRPGVPERLGLGYDRVAEINPALVYIYAGSYGSKGPQAHRPAFHSTPNALCGAGIVQAGRGNPPVDDGYPDPCGGLGVAAAIAIGLHGREQTGVGQYIETTMLTSTGYVQSDLVVQYPGRPDPLVPDKGQHGLHALYRLYPCSTGWLFLGAVQEKEWEALTAAVGHPEWTHEERYSSHASRLQHEDALVDSLSEVFSSRSAAEWQDSLLAHGVPAVQADSQTFEEFLVENVPHRPMTHPDFGDYWRRAPVIRVDGCEAVALSGPPTLGEHTNAILEELGYAPEDCQALAEAGVIGRER
jgi:crotonobetainyl-CoA:carnitine CoA-transferase CaiB-like acyl-CoA transferase/cytochrome P450